VAEASVVAGIYRAKGERVSMRTRLSCSRVECLRSAVTVLGDKDYCFDHFCSRCYELLERNQRFPGPTSSQEFHEELAELDDCARRALEISFGRVELNNLDRARLLDILLWAGDLTTALRHRRTAAPEIPGSLDGGRAEFCERGGVHGKRASY
jgi:hypothetical protein